MEYHITVFDTDVHFLCEISQYSSCGNGLASSNISIHVAVEGNFSLKDMDMDIFLTKIPPCCHAVQVYVDDMNVRGTFRRSIYEFLLKMIYGACSRVHKFILKGNFAIRNIIYV